MHDLVDNATSEHVDSHFLIRRQRTETSADAVDFGLTNGLEVVLQRDNRGHDIEGLDARLKALDLAVDNSFRAVRFFLAVGHVRGDSLLQVVNVVDEDAVELVHLRIDIARDSNVDEEHGAVLTAAKEQLAVLRAEDSMRRARRSDDDIAAVACLIELLKVDSLAVEFLRQVCCAVVGTVGHKDGRATMGEQMTSSEFAHLSRSH